MSELKEKIAEIINNRDREVMVHCGEFGGNGPDEVTKPLNIAKEILSLIQIEVKCPECGGDGDVCSGEVWDTVPCPNPNCVNGSITKFPESGDVGRIL